MFLRECFCMRMTFRLVDWVSGFSFPAEVGLIQSAEGLHRIQRPILPRGRENSSCPTTWARTSVLSCLWTWTEASALCGSLWVSRSPGWNFSVVPPGSQAFRFLLELHHSVLGSPPCQLTLQVLGHVSFCNHRSQLLIITLSSHLSLLNYFHLRDNFHHYNIKNGTTYWYLTCYST